MFYIDQVAGMNVFSSKECFKEKQRIMMLAAADVVGAKERQQY